MRGVGVGLVLLCVTLLSGCANLKAVRGFAEETRRISEAFDPMLGQAVEQCRLAFLHRRVYTTDAPLSGFDAEAALRSLDLSRVGAIHFSRRRSRVPSAMTSDRPSLRSASNSWSPLRTAKQKS